MSGLMQRYKGKVQVDDLWLGSGGLFDAVSGIKGLNDFIIKVPLPVTAVASTAFTVSLPPGGTLLNASVYTYVAYGAGTDCKISIGSAALDNSYLTGGAAVSIKALGVHLLALAQPAAAGPATLPNASPNLFITLAQTGTASATGSAFLVLNYTAQ
jgi:hypothetical protein